MLNVAIAKQAFHRAHLWLTLDGRMRLLQPWALLPGPFVLGLALAFPFRWLFFLGYAWLVFLVICYIWARSISSKVRLQQSVTIAGWAHLDGPIGIEFDLEGQVVEHRVVAQLGPAQRQCFV